MTCMCRCTARIRRLPSVTEPDIDTLRELFVASARVSLSPLAGATANPHLPQGAWMLGRAGLARLYALAMRNSPWSGPSGDEFARLIGERLRGVAGLTVEVRQTDAAVATPASFLVDVRWPADRG